MFDGYTIYVVLGIVFLATLIRSTFGFGEALVAVPLLALFLPVKVAAPVAVLISITVALIVTIQDWHHIHFDSAKRLVLSTLIGIPIGLLVLILFANQIVQAILGIVIITFALYRLVNQNGLKFENDEKAWIFGFGAGILGGAYGMNGPPLVVYGSLRRWGPKQFRATLQGYFLPASILAMVGYTIAGLWTYTVTWYFLLSLPVVILAIFLGGVLNRRISGRSFMLYIYAGLILIGIILFFQ
jgi:uncharacterized membrane protein YfcA